jgi:hypothetical protein
MGYSAAVTIVDPATAFETREDFATFARRLEGPEVVELNVGVLHWPG